MLIFCRLLSKKPAQMSFRKRAFAFSYVLKCSNKLKTHRHLSLLVSLTSSAPPQPAQRRRNPPDVLWLFLVWIMCVAKKWFNKKSTGVITSRLSKMSFTAVFSASEVEENFLCRSGLIRSLLLQPVPVPERKSGSGCHRIYFQFSAGHTATWKW